LPEFITRHQRISKEEQLYDASGGTELARDFDYSLLDTISSVNIWKSRVQVTRSLVCQREALLRFREF